MSKSNKRSERGISMKKDISKNSKKTIKNKKHYTKQDIILVATFVGLIILVLILGIVALNMDNLTKDNNSNIVIPILEANAENEISVEIGDMTKGDTKEYIFKVSNYKDQKRLNENVTYSIDILPTENVSVKVFKNGSTDNLLTKDDLLIENNNLKKDIKTEDLYKVVIKAASNPSKAEKITIKINS